jgi:hypothetical protein
MLNEEKINRLIQYAKDKQYDEEELSEHFANNFSILEPDNYNDDDIIFKKEIFEASRGWKIIHI